MLFAHALGREDEAPLAGNCAGGHRHGHRLGRAVGDFHGSCPLRSRRKGCCPVYPQLVCTRAVLPAAVGKRKRGVERIARRGEARGVRLHHEVRRDLRLHGAGAGGARVVGNCRHAHFADERGKLELHVRKAVLQRHVQLPAAERLEAPARHGADAVEEVSVRATASFHSRTLEAVVDDWKQVVVEVVKRMVGVARLAEPADGIGHLFVREQVDTLVHHRHGGVCATHSVKALRGNVRDEVAATGRGARNVRRHANVERAVARGHLDRHHAPGAVRGMTLSGSCGLHHAQCHVHARSKRSLHRLKLDLRRGIGERHYARVGNVAAHHLEPSVPLERGLHGDARNVARIIDWLVRDERHMRRRCERGAHGRIVVRAAHPV